MSNGTPMSDILNNLHDWYDEEVNLIGPETREQLGKEAVYAIAMANLREKRAHEIGQEIISFWDERLSFKKPLGVLQEGKTE